MRSDWFNELVNPWEDPGLVDAIDRSADIAIQGIDQGRRVEDLPSEAWMPPSKSVVPAGKEKDA